MTDLKPITLNIEISASEATTDELNHAVNLLQSDLREKGAESAEIIKNDTATTRLISLVIYVLPGLLSTIIESIQSWALHSSDRTVKFKGRVGDQTIEFEGSAGDLANLIEKLSIHQSRKLNGDPTTDAPPPKPKKE